MAAINAGAGDPQVIAAIGSVSNAVALSVRPSAGGQSIRFPPLMETPRPPSIKFSTATVAAALAQSVNQYDWAGAGLVNSVMASAAPDASLTITAARAGKVNVAGVTVTWVSGTRFRACTPATRCGSALPRIRSRPSIRPPR